MRIDETDMTLSLKKIRYFIATADAGQVSHAGMQLGVSQSAITAAVQQLETELGATLFLRHSQGVSLTAEGARFLQHARHIMSAVSEAVRAPLSEDTKLAGKVRIGVTYTVAGYFLPRHHARFVRTYPGITLELVELPREAIEQGLVDGSLDIAVMLVSNLRDKRHLAYETLIRSRRRLWLPLEHPFLNLETITLADIAEQPYVMLTVDEADETAGKYWRPSGLRPRTIFTTSSVEAVRSMVAAGMGVTVLSDMVYRPWSLEGQRIDTRSVVADIPTMDVGLAWDLGRPLSAVTKIFHDFLSMSFNGAGSALVG
ncbi:DNA-binding transcriptional regulator, LysR family [Rhizobiales bacterium GAS191]|jgi:DNA-binding transcriptional LysR family regulator|nr:DNA-binding transcriptional regulator, LysR family [Rhizobiales bacterium GAS113]SED66359.1 DNA-binding transcriptional regulator, LysR family [Rhizobiales bacterium GAS191]SEE74645.1 DNA-binding transcriptional regulator, LysR family [Rhizobiales bacterium GAS188]